MPPDLVFEMRSQKADEAYRLKIQSICKRLIMEYQDAIKGDLVKMGLQDSLFTPSVTVDEQQKVSLSSLLVLEKETIPVSFKSKWRVFCL